MIFVQRYTPSKYIWLKYMYIWHMIYTNGKVNMGHENQVLWEGIGPGVFLSPFFLDAPAWKSSSTLTQTLLYFMRQKKDRRAPEHSLVAPTGSSACTCSPAGDQGNSQSPGEVERCG